MTLTKLINRVLYNCGSSHVLMPDRIERELICAWCAGSFSWSGSPLDNRPLFCCKGHKQKSQVARKKRHLDAELNRPKTPREINTNIRYSTGTARACPRPEKERHGSFHEAQLVIDRVDKTMHPYTCRCGYIHIGH